MSKDAVIPTPELTIDENLWSHLASELVEPYSRAKIEAQHGSEVAQAIQRLSDFYIENPSQPTPWREPWVKAAYLSYYFPLNLIRARGVLERITRSLAPKKLAFSYRQIIDFGSGLGSGSFPFLEMESASEPHRLYHFVESSSEAIRIHRSLIGKIFDLQQAKSPFKWSQNLPEDYRPPPETLGIFSYALTELEQLPRWTSELAGLLIIEPSTSQDGRKLMTLREDLIAKGWSVAAPCTHQEACPLLSQSKHDWCHDRIHWSRPDWFLGIENNLPFKNKTLTYSYLYLTRKKESPNSTQSLARLIGDSVKEKGKTRQLVCRGPEREFLTWMNKDGEFAPLARGEIIAWPTDFQKVSNEIRLKANPQIIS